MCPADGRVLHLGRVDADGKLEQIKGVSYSLQQFLGQETVESVRKEEKERGEMAAGGRKEEKERGESGLRFVTIYLSPGDYHGFHSPANWRAFTRRHFPGNLATIELSPACMFNQSNPRRVIDGGTMGSEDNAFVIHT